VARKLEPFVIDVPQADLEDLRDRLDRTRWPDEAPGAGWTQGAPVDYVRELAGYWRTGYDWRSHEARLNSVPQFTIDVDGQPVHFLHVRASRPDALPLLLLHGWPGSFAELWGLIGPLSDPPSGAGHAFQLVIPSLPGFAYSTPLNDTGWEPRRIAGLFATLMGELGYSRYGVHGTDWGASVARELGLIAPDRLAGIHVTRLTSGVPSRDEADLDDPQERASVNATQRFQRELSGYGYLQSTRPQSLAYALTDSPAGQLAWIAERFVDWTAAEHAPEDVVDRDALLTNISLYWFTATAGSSARIYYDTAHSSSGWGTAEASQVPTGVAVFAHDISLPVRRIAERVNRIVHWSHFERGGHFAAMEAPDLLAADIRTMFQTLA